MIADSNQCTQSYIHPSMYFATGPRCHICPNVRYRTERKAVCCYSKPLHLNSLPIDGTPTGEQLGGVAGIFLSIPVVAALIILEKHFRSKA